MKKTPQLLITLVVTSLLLTGCGGSGSPAMSDTAYISGNGSVLEISQNKREVTPFLAGKTLTGEFTQTPGKVTVVNVWASWCTPCRAEAPTLQALSEKFPEIQFVGILTEDNETAARAFVKRFKITFPTLVDDSVLVKFAGATPNAIPTTLVIDKHNRIAVRISGEVLYTDLKRILTGISKEAEMIEN